MKLDERLHPVEYEFGGGWIKLSYDDTDFIYLDKSQRRALLKILLEMEGYPEQNAPQSPREARTCV